MADEFKRKAVTPPAEVQEGCAEADYLCMAKEVGWDQIGFYSFLAVIALVIMVSLLRSITGRKGGDRDGMLSDEEIAAIEARARATRR